MKQQKKINSALISVYHKDKLEPIINELKALNVKIYSTGGTQEYLSDLGAEVTSVESITDYPSILGGRVKTLHPKIFGGILGRQDHQDDVKQLTQYEIPVIDLVIVDLYPFEETVLNESDEKKIIEKIDIGGISLIRAAAKNYNDVLIIPSSDDYEFLLQLLKEKKGHSGLEDRKKQAGRAFNVSSHYDTAIFKYFGGEEKVFKQSIISSKKLRYGENPHQEGYYYGSLDDEFEQLNGKALSYNNLVDVDGAVAVIEEFNDTDKCACAVIKHTNACGVATRRTVLEAWQAALAGDPVSAFGGIIIFNKVIDAITAKAINTIFFEVIIAPGYDENALTVLKEKKNRIILKRKSNNKGNNYQVKKQFKTILNGVIEQNVDWKTETIKDLETVTKKEPSGKEKDDLVFANKVVKQLKSNTIVLVKDEQLLGSGVGQTSRVDALKQAIAKAKNFNFDLKGAVMASDAFFPFSDCVEIAHGEGITAIIQPGGSIRDKDSIDFCNTHDLSMVFTHTRHFKH